MNSLIPAGPVKGQAECERLGIIFAREQRAETLRIPILQQGRFEKLAAHPTGCDPQLFQRAAALERPCEGGLVRDGPSPLVIGRDRSWHHRHAPPGASSTLAV